MKTYPRGLSLIVGALFSSLVLLPRAEVMAADPPQGPAPAAPAPAQPPPAPTLTNDEASYLFGLTLGEQLKMLGLADGMKAEVIDRGVREGLAGKKSSQEDRKHVQEYVRASLAAQGERNAQAAKDFLAKNAKEKGVKTTASGLEYKVLAAGDPKAPAVNPTDQVTVNYRGHLIDGSEFDSSYARGTPATFPLNGVIKGWQEGVALMKPGAKFELFVPPELGYGPGAHPGIPGNSLLIFDVELISAKPASANASPGEGESDGAVNAMKARPRHTPPPAAPPAAPPSTSAPAAPPAQSSTSP